MKIFIPPPHQRCNADASSYVVCGNATSVGMGNSTDSLMLIPGTDVLELLEVRLPFYINYPLLIIIGVIFRILAYFALRFLHRNHQ